MADNSEELISAYMDEETSAFESRLCIHEMVSDQSSRARWERYHIIRDALQGNLPTLMHSQFSSDVMEKVLHEDSLNARIKLADLRFSSRYLKPLGGFALAASVATLSFLGVRFINSETKATSPVVAQRSDDRTPVRHHTQVSKRTNPIPRQAWPLTTKDEARLNSYLVNHAEYASRTGIMPYVRIVGYDINPN